jgi:hypothetical protein
MEITSIERNGKITIDYNTIKNVIFNIAKRIDKTELEDVTVSTNADEFIFDIVLKNKKNNNTIQFINDFNEESARLIAYNLNIVSFTVITSIAE